MRATVDGDIIVNIGSGDTVIPDDYPRNVGLERLRWDGERVVDLATLPGFWVENRGGALVLHCVECEGCTYIEMTYADRKRLIVNGAAPRLQTAEEIAAEKKERVVNAARAELSRVMDKTDTLYEVMAFAIGLISAALIYARTPNATLRNQIGTNIDAILNELQALPLNRMLQGADNKLTRLKGLLETFYGKVDAAGG
jgi:hypothetical protein